MYDSEGNPKPGTKWKLKSILFAVIVMTFLAMAFRQYYIDTTIEHIDTLLNSLQCQPLSNISDVLKQREDVLRIANPVFKYSMLFLAWVWALTSVYLLNRLFSKTR